MNKRNEKVPHALSSEWFFIVLDEGLTNNTMLIIKKRLEEWMIDLWSKIFNPRDLVSDICAGIFANVMTCLKSSARSIFAIYESDDVRFKDVILLLLKVYAKKVSRPDSDIARSMEDAEKFSELVKKAETSASRKGLAANFYRPAIFPWKRHRFLH